MTHVLVDESIRAPGRLLRANAASAPPKQETAVPPSGSLKKAATMDQESVCGGSSLGESTSCSVPSTWAGLGIG